MNQAGSQRIPGGLQGKQEEMFDGGILDFIKQADKFYELLNSQLQNKEKVEE